MPFRDRSCRPSTSKTSGRREWRTTTYTYVYWEGWTSSDVSTLELESTSWGGRVSVRHPIRAGEVLKGAGVGR